MLFFRNTTKKNVFFSLLADEHPAAGSLLTQADPGRRMPWSEHETRTLLNIWGEDTVQLTLRGSLKNRHVFEYISEKMNDNGFTRTTDQCYTRIKRLKYGFHHEKSVVMLFELLSLFFFFLHNCNSKSCAFSWNSGRILNSLPR